MVKEIKHKRESVLSWNEVIGWIRQISGIGPFCQTKTFCWLTAISNQ